VTGVDDLRVTGGVTGLEVRADDLDLAACALASAGADLAAVAALAGRTAVEADLASSALLDPAGAARAAAALAAALAGPSGLGVVALSVGTTAGRLRLAAARYRSADAVALAVTDARRWVQGAAGVLALPAVVTGVGWWWASATVRGHDPTEDASDLLREHPGVVDEVVGSSPGALSVVLSVLLGPGATVARARGGPARSLPESAGLLALLYPDGVPRARVVRREAVAVPAGLGDLLAGLDAVDRSARGARQGEVAVVRQSVPGPDGQERVSWVVHLPGTRDWQVVPGPRTSVNDLATNLELLAGEPSARVAALQLALGEAGVREGEPVLLVGHSQGGMVALRAAAELRGVTVTHVVTAGSPVGRMPVPDGVSVLSLENRQDVVPRLDAAPNPSSGGHVTAAFDVAGRTVVEEHDLAAAYLPAARALDASADPAVRGWLASADAFLADDTAGDTAGGTATSTVVRLSAG
jgi:hypothetical protein